MKNKFFRNSVSGAVQVILTVILTFFTIPIFISKLGIKNYGIFATVSVIGNLNVFTNLGLNTTLKKYLAQQGKTIESNHDIIVTLSVVSILTFIGSALLIALNEQILINIMNIPTYIYEETKIMFYFIVFSNALLLIGQIFEAVLDSQEEIEITNYSRLIYNFFYWGFILFFLLMGYSLSSVGISIFMASSLWFIIILIFTRKRWGVFYVQRLKKNFFQTLKKQFVFSSRIYIASLLTFLGEPVIKILISNVYNISYVGFYEIAMRIRSYIWTFLNKLIYPLFPIIAKEKNKEILSKIVNGLEEKLFFLVIPIIALLILGTNSFVDLWLKQNVNNISILIITLVSFHLLMNLTISPGLIFFTATNYPGVIVLINLTYGLVNIIIYLVLRNSLDIWTIVLAEFMGLFSAFVVTLFYQKKYLGNISFIKSSTLIIKYLIIAIVLILLGALIFFLNFSAIMNLAILLILIPFTSLILYGKLVVYTPAELNWLIPSENIIKRIMINLLAKERK